MYILVKTSIYDYIENLYSIISDKYGDKDSRIYALYDEGDGLQAWILNTGEYMNPEPCETSEMYDLINRLIEDTFDGITADYTSLLNAINYIYDNRLDEDIDEWLYNEPDTMRSLGVW